MARDRRLRTVASGGCAALIAMIGSAAAAQEAAPASGFTYDAGASIGYRFLDNVYSTENDKVADSVFVLEPFAEFAYREGPFRLGFTAAAELGRYAAESSEDYNDVRLDLETVTRLGGGFTLLSGADIAWEHEERSSPDAVNGVEPTLYRDGGGYVGLGWRGDDLGLRLGASVRRLDYDDVDGAPPGPAVIDNDDRDRTTGEFGGRVSYRIAPERDVFVQALYDLRDYDEAPTVDRDSDGVQAAVGVSGALGPVRGEALVGVMAQDYDEPGFDTTTALDLGAELSWRPAPDVSMRFILDRTIEETTIAASSGYVSTAIGLRGSKRVAPNLSARAYAFVTQNDYREITRTDYLTELGAGLRWHYTPHVFFGVDYGFTERDSDVAGADYLTHTVMLRAGAALDPVFDTDAPRAAAGPGEFYVGAHVGDQGLTSSLSGVRGGGGVDNLVVDFGGLGLLGGGFVGYRVPFGSLELGAELDADFGGASWRDEGERDFGVERRIGLGLSATLGTRLANGVRLYAKAGPVATEYDSDYTRGADSEQDTEFRLGLRGGVGAEVPLSGAWSARLEYLVTASEDYDFGTQNPQDNFANFENTARLGLVYSFGAEPRPEAQTDPEALTGAYVGVQGGHGALLAENSGLRGGGTPTVTDRGSLGLTGGVFAGYGARFGDFWLGGEVEAEVSGATVNLERDPLGREISMQKVATVGAAARVGYLVSDSVLLYGRAGLVNSWFDTDYATGGGSVSETDSQSGVRFGGGVEFTLTENTTMRLDYTRTEYESFDVDYGTGVDSFDPSENLFRVGVAYRF
jgi:opacity protein-like surface antigen